MFAFNPTLQIVLLNVVIVLFLGVVGVYTLNPLVILGLFLVQQVPIVTNEKQIDETTDAEGNPLPRADDYNESTIGFLAEVKTRNA